VGNYLFIWALIAFETLRVRSLVRASSGAELIVQPSSRGAVFAALLRATRIEEATTPLYRLKTLVPAFRRQ